MRLRYAREDDSDPAALKQAYVKTKGVESTSIRHQERLVELAWRGLCRDMAQFESIAEKAGTPAFVISHAAVACAVKAGKGASADRLKKELAAVDGVLHLQSSSGAATLHADLEKLDVGKLRAAASAAGYELAITSHARITASVAEGEPERIARTLLSVKGVLTSTAGDGRVALWATARVTDDALKAAVSRIRAALGAIER